MNGIYLRRNWGGEYENVAILVAIAVNEDGYREALGAAEGMKEDKASWVNFFQWLKSRGLDGVKLIVGDKCLGMLEAVGEVFPDAKYQRCTVHFYRNVFSVVPRSKVKLVAKMLKAIHAQESKKAAREKAKAVVTQLREMKLKEAAKKVEDSVEETLTYCDFPYEHWTRIRTNNVIERLNREILRRTRVVGTFPDGNSALMLVCARLRHVTGTQWGNKKYMNMKHLEAVHIGKAAVTAPRHLHHAPRPRWRGSSPRHRAAFLPGPHRCSRPPDCGTHRAIRNGRGRSLCPASAWADSASS